MTKIAILGTGMIANKMAATITDMPSVEAYAVASRNGDRAKAFAEKHRFAKAYDSYEEMLSDNAIDLVYIAVPHSHHFKCMMMSIEAGKNVLCEKPFTVNAGQSRTVLDFAKEKRLLAAEAMWTRYMPSRRIITDIIVSGAIGEVTSLTANLGYELTDIERIWDINLAGGALLDVGCYLVNFAKMVFEGDITGIHSSAVFKSGIDAIDNVSLMFDDAKMATMQCSVVAAQNRRGSIHGTKGYIEVTNINNPELIEVFDSNYKKIATHEIPKQITGLEYEVEACMRAMDEGKIECEDMPHSEIIAVMEALDEIRDAWGYEIPLAE